MRALRRARRCRIGLEPIALPVVARCCSEATTAQHLARSLREPARDPCEAVALQHRLCAGCFQGKTRCLSDRMRGSGSRCCSLRDSLPRWRRVKVVPTQPNSSRLAAPMLFGCAVRKFLISTASRHAWSATSRSCRRNAAPSSAPAPSLARSRTDPPGRPTGISRGATENSAGPLVRAGPVVVQCLCCS